ncbi:carbohydrate ABC transporter substrate-binding protein (CUT1 family) [Thermosporothrix hazakensis]|jgi:multiple sugar transport system substrate-binding protein|uniref:Carbohydrate ABC transporter substrate-binding protein (CUT1 family) n=1 Tax=Thermosporothrix hazakensis TaxID=644383 RepID=A0A326UAA7_THEHA|nr:ABC transporter substrate-binding protein [Thermosporothrix hazakensis]PZW24665.1 carbohydrate ABC transporter substrate-binding protein (CUT1 family) [Thermosporothrix hazakensis]GCE48387.1 ABC transporter substrate-binding protein [Thermosporothrix hazakensis]
MDTEQRQFLDDILSGMRSGRITRRTFLERATLLGLTSTSALSLLEACGGSASGANTLVWQSENDTSNTYGKLTEAFNTTVGKKNNIAVVWRQGPNSTDDLLTRYTTTLRARGTSIDILSLDVVYPAQFAANAWIQPLDKFWTPEERKNYLQSPLQACTYQGKLWAAPFRTDIGLLYYRSDLLSHPPKTWEELSNVARTLQPQTKYGFVWQGAQYEGLVCNFAEVLHSYGGAVLDTKDPTNIKVNDARGRAALSTMVNWVGTISPDAVITYQEQQSLDVFKSGDALFMRNWPFAIAISNDAKQSRIPRQFEIGALPAGDKEGTGHSTIGGWNLAINAFLPEERARAAWEFIKYMLSPEAQKIAALEATFTVTLASIYGDADVLKQHPEFARFKPILEQSQPRPVSPKYTAVSNAIQKHIFRALKHQVTPVEALANLETELNNIINPR